MVSSFSIPKGDVTVRGAPGGAILESQQNIRSGIPLFPTLKGTQTTMSEDHPDWVALDRAIRMGSPSPVPRNRDWGGEFSMYRTWIESPSPAIFHTTSAPFFSSSWGQNVISEKRFPLYTPLTYNQSLFPPFASSGPSALDALGSTAISRCSPTNSVANLTVATVEMFRDGLPNLVGSTTWESRAAQARDAGEEYLNYEFGWLPLVSDIKSFANGVVNLDRLQKQLLQDSGRNVRRRYSFPPQVLRSETVISTSAQAGGPFDINGYDQKRPFTFGKVVRSRVTTINQWFSGSFTYHCPPSFFGDFGEHVSRAERILGLDLTPEAVWQLTPWSWATSWFSNVGDCINNLSNYSSYGQVLRYGYIMEHTVVRDTYTYIGDVGFIPEVKFTGYPPPFVICSETKLRRRATPFGFGFKASSLTPTHLAIMAALGLVFLA